MDAANWSRGMAYAIDPAAMPYNSRDIEEKNASCQPLKRLVFGLFPENRSR